jgi:prevent-host-death family protein
MLIETNNLVSAEEFRREFEKYLRASRQGCGPIAVTRDAEVVGVFISAEEYEAMFGAAVKRLLTERMTGATVSQAEARAHVRAAIRKQARKA